MYTRICWNHRNSQHLRREASYFGDAISRYVDVRQRRNGGCRFYGISECANDKQYSNMRTIIKLDGSFQVATKRYTATTAGGKITKCPATLKLNKRLNELAKMKTSDSADKTLRFLLDACHKAYTYQQDDASGKYLVARPDVVSYSIVLNALARSASKKNSAAGLRAEKLLVAMEQIYDREGRTGIRPNVVSYNSVLTALTRSGDMKRALALLDRMEDICQKDSYETTEMMPNAKSLTIIISALAKSHEEGSEIEAEKILKRMEVLSKNDVYSHLKPDFITYSTVISALGKSESRNSAEKAESILFRMEKLYQEGNRDLRPDVVTWTSVVDAWAMEKNADKDTSNRAQRLVDAMKERATNGQLYLQPNLHTYTSLIKAYGKSRQPAKAENVLRQLLEDYDLGDIDIRPDLAMFNACINSWARSSIKSECGEKAEGLLALMEKLYQAGHYDLKPNILIFNSTINAWSEVATEKAAKRADKLFKRIVHSSDLQPNTVTFNILMKVWVKSNVSDAAETVDCIFDQMEKLCCCGNKNAKPDGITYRTLIWAWKRSKQPIAKAKIEYLQGKMRQIG